MKLSVVLIAYDMAREIPRTLRSLSRGYQRDAAALDYEVILVDNGSPQPLDASTWSDIDVPVRLIRLDDAPASPARAINVACSEARGDILALMIDGAHLLSPGVFAGALSAFSAFADPVVAIRYFYLGLEEQTVSVEQGYNQEQEDQLLQRIGWPEEGYRLYEVATPLRSGARQMTWFNRMPESACLFMKRSLFAELGGAEERFDYPGGGFLNLDIFKRAIEAPQVTAVQLIGEGSFHQFHGGTTTNANRDTRAARLAKYRRQYEEIRGRGNVMTTKSFYFMGHMPTRASNITAVERRRARAAAAAAAAESSQ